MENKLLIAKATGKPEVGEADVHIAWAEDEDEDETLDMETDDMKQSSGFVPRKVSVFKDEQSVRERKSLTRGAASIKQTIGMHVISTSALNLPERQSKHYPGQTNKGTCIGPVVLDKQDQLWQMSLKDKRKMFTKKFRHEVGGKTEGGATKKSDADLEPVCFNGMPRVFYDDIVHRYFIANVFDLTPLDFELAMYCISEGVNYFAIAMSPEHAAEGKNKLTLCMLHCMCNSKHALFNEKCAKFFKLQDLVTPDAKTKPKPKKRTSPSKDASDQKNKEAKKDDGKKDDGKKDDDKEQKKDKKKKDLKKEKDEKEGKDAKKEGKDAKKKRKDGDNSDEVLISELESASAPSAGSDWDELDDSDE